MMESKRRNGKKIHNIQDMLLNLLICKLNRRVMRLVFVVLLAQLLTACVTSSRITMEDDIYYHPSKTKRVEEVKSANVTKANNVAFQGITEDAHYFENVATEKRESRSYSYSEEGVGYWIGGYKGDEGDLREIQRIVNMYPNGFAFFSSSAYEIAMNLSFDPEWNVFTYDNRYWWFPSYSNRLYSELVMGTYPKHIWTIAWNSPRTTSVSFRFSNSMHYGSSWSVGIGFRDPYWDYPYYGGYYDPYYRPYYGYHHPYYRPHYGYYDPYYHPYYRPHYGYYDPYYGYHPHYGHHKPHYPNKPNHPNKPHYPNRPSNAVRPTSSTRPSAGNSVAGARPGSSHSSVGTSSSSVNSSVGVRPSTNASSNKSNTSSGTSSTRSNSSSTSVRNIRVTRPTINSGGTNNTVRRSTTGRSTTGRSTTTRPTTNTMRPTNSNFNRGTSNMNRSNTNTSSGRSTSTRTRTGR